MPHLWYKIEKISNCENAAARTNGSVVYRTFQGVAEGLDVCVADDLVHDREAVARYVLLKSRSHSSSR